MARRSSPLLGALALVPACDEGSATLAHTRSPWSFTGPSTALEACVPQRFVAAVGGLSEGSDTAIVAVSVDGRVAASVRTEVVAQRAFDLGLEPVSVSDERVVDWGRLQIDVLPRATRCCR